MSAVSEILDTPSALSLIRQIGDALFEGRSAVIVLPHPLRGESLWERVMAREPLRSERLVASFPAAACSSVGPIHQLAQYFGTATGSLDAILDSPGFPDVLHLANLDALESPERKAWLDLIKLWADVTHRRASDGKSKKPLVTFLNSPDHLLATTPFLVRLFGSAPSPLELRLLCTRSNQQTDIASRLWREALLPELAGQDVELLDALEELDEESLVNLNKVNDLLMTYGESLAWNKELGEIRGKALPEDPFPETLKQPWLSLWLKGILCQSSEHSWTLHSAFLAIQGNPEQLKHRLWRGQARLLLPLLDELRRSLCDLLSHRTPEWHVHVQRVSFNGVTDLRLDSAYEAEWSDLTRPLERCGRGIAAEAERARRIRNRIAHYEIVPYREYLEFWRNRKIARISPLPYSQE